MPFLPAHSPPENFLSRWVFALSAALAIVSSLPRAAHANGRFPTSQYVLAGPGALSSTIALRTTFGVVESTDHGMTWTWMCEAMFGYGTTNTDPSLALAAATPTGVPLLLGLPDGVARTTDFCASTRVGSLAGLYSGDMTTDPTGATVYWVGSDVRNVSTVWASTDGGQGFTARGPGVPGVNFTTLEVSASDPQRMYLSGYAVSPFRAVLYRSDDGGMTLRELSTDLHGGTDAWISGVDGTHEDTVYVRSHTNPSDGGAPGSLLLRSTDGGMSFTVIYRSVGDLKGFALSDDGQTVWTGGPDPSDGLQRADGGGSFHPVSNVQVLCLRWHAGELLVCANDLQDGFALGRSSDGGQRIVPILRFRDLTCPSGCPVGTLGHDYCALQWPEVEALIQPFTAPDSGVAPAGMDAGIPMDSALVPPMDGGLVPSVARPAGGCSAAPVRPSPWGVLAAMFVRMAARRRPRKAPSPRRLPFGITSLLGEVGDR